MYTNIIFCNRIAPNIPQQKTLDIRARGAYPAGVLSNLSNTEFEFDGVKIKSVEGFLQSLKVRDAEEQQKICGMSGFDAKKLSRRFRQSNNEMLYFWNGQAFTKNSKEFKALLNDVLKAYKESGGKFPFEYKDLQINSINTFITALHEHDPAKQRKLMQMSEQEINKAAREIDYKFIPRTLFWQGKTFNRESAEFRELITQIYKARLKKDPEFRDALYASKGRILTHSKGKMSTDSTILTTKEFLEIMETLRGKLGKYLPK